MSTEIHSEDLFTRLTLESIADLPFDVHAPFGLAANDDANAEKLSKAVFELGKSLNGQLDAAEQMRSCLAVMRNYREPVVSEEVRNRAGVVWPEYTMASYATDIRRFAEKHQTVVTVKFAEAAGEIVNLSNRMKERLNDIFELLDARAEREQFRPPLVGIQSLAQKGRAMAQHIQSHIVEMNKDMADLRRGADALRDGYRELIPKLMEDYNRWAMANGKPRAEDLKKTTRELLEDIKGLQDEVAKKEREMIAAGSVGAMTIFVLGGVVALSCAIALSVLGPQRVKFLERLSVLAARVGVLEGAIAVQVFVDQSMDDIKRMEARLGELQSAVKGIGEGFMKISQKLHDIDLRAGDNIDLIRAGIAPDRRDMDAMRVSLDVIIGIAEKYQKHALRAEAPSVEIVNAA